MEPLGHPNRPKIGTKSHLDTILFQKRYFSRNAVWPRRNPILRPQDGSQDDPRSAQDHSKTIFKLIFFRLRFCLRFWCLLGAILASSWLPFGLSKISKCRRLSHLNDPKTTLTTQDGPRWLQDRTRRLQDPSRPLQDPLKTSKRLPKTPQNDQKSTQHTPKTTKHRSSHPIIS